MGSVWFSGLGDVFSGDEERRPATADQQLIIHLWCLRHERALSALVFSIVADERSFGVMFVIVLSYL